MILLFGCSENHNGLIVVFDDGNGISINDPITLNERHIGQVTNVEIDQEYKVLVSLSFHDTLPPQGSQIFITEIGFMGERAIEIKPSRSSFTMIPGDTIHGSIEQQNNSATHSISSLLEKISHLLSQDENDSLLNEITTLKAKVDSLESVRNNIDSTRNALNDSSLQSNET